MLPISSSFKCSSECVLVATKFQSGLNSFVTWEYIGKDGGGEVVVHGLEAGEAESV